MELCQHYKVAVISFSENVLQQIEYLVYYVSFEQSQADIKWVENAKTLFKVRTHVASTIYAQVQLYLLQFFAYRYAFKVCKKKLQRDTDIVLLPSQDLHLHKFFQHCQLMRTTSEGNQAELIKYLKVRYCEAAHSHSLDSRDFCMAITEL